MMMMARVVLVTYETIRQWCRKFGQTFANQLRRRRPRPDDKSHLNEVALRAAVAGHRQAGQLWCITALPAPPPPTQRPQYRHEMDPKALTQLVA